MYYLLPPAANLVKGGRGRRGVSPRRRVPYARKETGPCSIRLQSGPRVTPVYKASQQGAHGAGRWGRLCEVTSEQTARTKTEPMRFLKARQTAQGKKYPVM